MSQAVVFEVAGERFALPIAAVTQVVRGAWPLKLGRAPWGCVGALDVRGEILPLLDLGALLGLRHTLRRDRWAEALLDAHVLVVTCGGTPLALLVDKVAEIADTVEGKDRVLAVAPGGDQELCAVLDPDSLVGAGRRRLLQRAAMRARAGDEGAA